MHVCIYPIYIYSYYWILLILSIEGQHHRQSWGSDATSTRRLQQQSLDLPLKKTTNIYRVSTKVLNKSNPIHGGGNTDMHRINQG